MSQFNHNNKKNNKKNNNFNNKNEIGSQSYSSKHSDKNNKNSKFIQNSYRRVRQPGAICTLCGKKIIQAEDTFTNVTLEYFKKESSNNNSDNTNENEIKLCHFECALKYLKEKFNVKPPEKISYIGCGKFGIFDYDKNEKRYISKKVIELESQEDFKKLQSYIQSLKE